MDEDERELIVNLIETNQALIAANTARVIKIEDHTIILNREMGQVLGQLTWIRWLLCAVLGVIIAGYFIL